MLEKNCLQKAELIKYSLVSLAVILAFIDLSSSSRNKHFDKAADKTTYVTKKELLKKYLCHDISVYQSDL